MKKLITLLILLSIQHTTNAQSWQWAKNALGLGDDAPNAIAKDKQGNVYVAGWFGGNYITFGAITLNTIAESEDLFIVKYDSLGNVLWAKTAVLSNIYANANAISLITDNQNNIYVSGYFDDTAISFGGFILNGSIFSNQFLVKYDSLGNELWAKNIPGKGYGYALAIDKASNIYATGSFADSIVIDTTKIMSIGASNTILIKYDTNGNIKWAKNSVGAKITSGSKCITSDSLCTIYIAGSFQSPYIIFGSDSLFNIDTTGAKSDLFLVKYDSLGNVILAKVAGSDSDDYVYDITTDIYNNVILAGGYGGPIMHFGSISLSGAYQTYIAKYKDNGNPIWAENIIGATATAHCSIKTDKYGAIFVSGVSGTTITIGYSTLNLVNENLCVAKLDTAGNGIWCIGSNIFTDVPLSFISLDNANNLYITGVLWSTNISLGTTILTNPNTDIWDNNPNVFVAKLNTFNNEVPIKLANENNIAIYPNPTEGIFTVDIPSFNENIVIKITDIYGKVIETRKIINKISLKEQFNLFGLPFGEYIINVNIDGNAKGSKLIYK